MGIQRGRDDINPDNIDNDSLVSLLCASHNEDEEAVEIRLRCEDGCHDNSRNVGQTLLLQATDHRPEGAAKVEIGRDTAPGIPADNGPTPLFGASYDWHQQNNY